MQCVTIKKLMEVILNIVIVENIMQKINVSVYENEHKFQLVDI
jgi:hypothetical protein